jgi:hypothetical protein
VATNLGAIAIAALIGAGGAVLVLRANTPAQPEASADPAIPVASASSAASTVQPGDPWAAAKPATAPPHAGGYAVQAARPSELPDIRPQDLADPELARIARDRFSQDCPAIVERGATRNGRFDVTCTNGVVLRVHAMDGELTRIGPLGPSRPVRGARRNDE